MTPAGSLDRLIDPRSVAINGASDDGARLSGRPLRYTLEAGFKGAIHPINPTRSTVQGLPCYASVRDVPAPPDVAIIAVASRLVRAAVERFAVDCASAVSAAGELGFPVVMKVVSLDIRHKTEVGGVVLGIPDAVALTAAHGALLARVSAAMPAATIEGVLIAPMARKGVETIIGVLRDATFGPVVMFGLGGIFVEVLRDVTFRRAPFCEEEAMRMIAEVKGRGGAAPDALIIPRAGRPA